MGKIEDFLEKNPKGNKKKPVLEPYKEIVFLLRDSHDFSYAQIKKYFFEEEDLKVSTKTICNYYNKNKKSISASTTKSIHTKNLKSIPTIFIEEDDFEKINDDEFLSLDSEKQICYCHKLHKSGKKDEFERLLKLLDSATRFEAQNAIRDEWFDC